MSYTLGIDIGTYESKGVLVDAGGKITARAAKAHKMQVPQPGWAEHHPDEDWWGDFVHITNALIAKSRVDPKAIRALSCSAIGPCMLPVDKNGVPLSHGILYGVDNRAAAQVNQLTADIGEQTLIDKCGNALTSQSVGPKILWFKQTHPDLFQKAHKFLTSTSYIVQKLTGETVIDHYTAANFGPLYLIDSLSWSSTLCDAIVAPEQLADIHWSDAIVGTVSVKAARETGLAPGTPVTTGTIDAAAEALSVGVLDAGDMMMMYGSTLFLIMLTHERVRDPCLWYAPWLFKGQHASLAGLATSGTLTHWFRDQFARELSRAEAFTTLAREAATSPPGANGLVLLPYFSGERTPIHDPNAKGVYFGLDLTHTRGDMYRALIEGIALGTGHVIKTYRDIGQVPKHVYAVGGGTKNRLWLQATSDVCGLVQSLRAQTLGASYGDAFLASVAVGDASPVDIAHWNPLCDQIAPDLDNVLIYQQRYKQFRALYEATKHLMH